MQAVRLTCLTILFAAVLTGCLVQADTFSDQNPFSAPDTLQSSGDGSVENPTNTPAPLPTATSTPTETPQPTPTLDKDDYIPTPTGYPLPASKDK